MKCGRVLKLYLIPTSKSWVDRGNFGSLWCPHMVFKNIIRYVEACSRSESCQVVWNTSEFVGLKYFSIKIPWKKSEGDSSFPS